MKPLVEAALAAQELRATAARPRGLPNYARTREGLRTCRWPSCPKGIASHNRSGLCAQHGREERMRERAEERRRQREARRARGMDPTLADTCADMLAEWAGSRVRVGSVYAGQSEFDALVARMRAVGDRVRSSAK